MNVPKDYADPAKWCPFCLKETPQEIHEDGHERDSSYDSETCTVCGAYHLGMVSGYTLGGERRSELYGNKL